MQRRIRADAAALAVVLCFVAVHAVVLRAELSIARHDLNDDVFHFGVAAHAATALEQGRSPLDFWVPEWSFGYPVPRTYPTLGHQALALLYLALGKSVSLMTLFVWVRFLLVALLPLTFFVAARWIGLGLGTALAAAALAPLVSTDGLYGVEYGSFLWRGSGLYAQAWGTQLLLLALGAGCAAILRGRGLVLAAGLLSLSFLAHFLYGYVGALSLCLLALVPHSEPRRRRLLRLGLVGGLSAALCAFALVPLLQDAGWVNRSRWEPGWKTQSLGAAAVLRLLFTGELLDFGRAPGLSLLALAGSGACLLDVARRRAGDAAPSAFLLAGALCWTLLFFGPRTLGPLPAWLGAHPDLHLHRLIGAVHVFLLLLAATGLARGVRLGSGRPLWSAAALLGVGLLLAPAVRERLGFLREGAVWGEENRAAYQREAVEVRRVIERVRERPGRAYAGLAGGWGRDFRVGWMPFYAILGVEGVPALSYLYHVLALPGDLMVRFDEWNPAHYRLFDVATVVADEGRLLPPFVTPLEPVGRFRLLAAPGGGAFELVSVPYAIACDRRRFYEVNDPWLQSDWVAKGRHLLLDFAGEAAPGLPRLTTTSPLPPIEATPVLGAIEREGRAGGAQWAAVRVEREGFLLFKATHHPNWRFLVDGEPRPAVMVSPGFPALRLTPGQHVVEASYRASPTPLLLLALDVPLLAAAAALERRRGVRSRRP